MVGGGGGWGEVRKGKGVKCLNVTNATLDGDANVISCRNSEGEGCGGWERGGRGLAPGKGGTGASAPMTPD